jgi:hypothetical protein
MSVTNSPDPDPRDDKTEVMRLNRTAQKAIGIIAFVLPLLFAYLSFKDVPIQDILKSLSSQSAASILWKITLTIYFLAWVFGTKNDAEDQELVYRHVPDRGRLSSQSIGVIAGIFVLMAILLWSPNFELFAGALSAFFLFNIFAWRYLVSTIVNPSVEASLASIRSRGDYVGGEELLVVADYLRGRWQWYRFSLGALIIVGLWGLVAIKYLQIKIPGIPESVSWELAQVFGIIIYVVVLELWIWSKRLQTKIALDFLEDFAERYTLVPKKAMQAE